MESLLILKNLDVAYKKDKKILNEINLALPQRSVCGLVGKNGAGKTTLIKTLSSVFNEDIYDLEFFNFLGNHSNIDSAFYKQNKYTVFTENDSFLNWTFENYFELVCKLYDVSIDHERLSDLIKGFQFQDYCKKEIRFLSTGNKKKVFLIVGLYLCRPLLILDEPFDGLDFEATEYLYKKLAEYKLYGTVFMSSHFAESIARVCDCLYILENGGLTLFQGDLSDWLEKLKRERTSDDLESDL